LLTAGDEFGAASGPLSGRIAPVKVFWPHVDQFLQHGLTLTINVAAFHAEPEVVWHSRRRLGRRLSGRWFHAAAGVEAVWVAVPDVPGWANPGRCVGCGMGRVVVLSMFSRSAALNGGMFDPASVLIGDR